MQERSPSRDDRLHGKIVACLESSGHYQLRRVAVKVQGSRVSLQGRVSSYYMKQLAQSFVLRMAGVKQLENELVVT